MSQGSRFVVISVTFLDPLFHGRADGDEPEWPPSPLRLFQAMVAGTAAASRAAEGMPEADLAPLRWLEQQPSPLIIAPLSRRGQAYRLSVPNNAMDVVAAAWARGNDSGRGDANPATHRSMKMVTPIALERSDTVHYAWRIPENSKEAVDVVSGLQRNALNILALGWGIDLVFGAAREASEEEINGLSGERWVPATRSVGQAARVPISGTLAALEERHKKFMARLAVTGRFSPTPAMTCFARCHYARATDKPPRPFAAYQFLSTEESDFRSFRATQSARVAGMVRHCVAVAATRASRSAEGLSSEEWVDQYVHGHRREGAKLIGRFSYLPLPTIDPRGVVDRIRRAIVAEPLDGVGNHAAWIGRSLIGEQLIDERTGDAEATLAACPNADYVLARYVRPSRRWATVTPVVLPWGDSGKPHRAEKQFLKAVRHSGYDVEDIANLELQREPFWRGCDSAGRYFVPKHLRGTASWHVSLEWKHVIAGPIVIGSGRHCGLGLFAAADGG